MVLFSKEGAFQGGTMEYVNCGMVWASVYVCDVVEVQCHIVGDFCMRLKKIFTWLIGPTISCY